MAGGPTCGRPGCGQPVVRAITEPGQQWIVLDAIPTEEGEFQVNLDVVPVPTARKVRDRETSPAHFWGPTLYRRHAETCRAIPSQTGPSDTTDVQSADESGR